MVLKVSPDTREHLESKETEDHQGFQDLQDNQDFLLLVVVVSPDHQASQESEVRKEKLALQDCLCQVPQDVRGPQAPRVHQGFQDLQAFPQDKTVSLESLGVLVFRAREVTQERQARKVTRATPV